MKTMTASKHFSTIINNSGLKPTQDSKIRKVYLKIFHGCVEGDVNGEGGGIMVWAQSVLFVWTVPHNKVHYRSRRLQSHTCICTHVL